MNKGLSAEAGVFDTISAGSSLAITTIAGVFQALGFLSAPLGDVLVLCDRVTAGLVGNDPLYSY